MGRQKSLLRQSMHRRAVLHAPFTYRRKDGWMAARLMCASTRASITIVITSMQVKIQGFQFIWLLEESLHGLSGTLRLITPRGPPCSALHGRL